MPLIKDVIDDPYKGYFAKTAIIESNNNPNAKAKTSSAVGLYQFTENTWKELVKKYDLGYNSDDRFIPSKAEKVMRLFTQDNERVLQPILGRQLTDGERYLGHFLGVGGASNLFKALQKNPNMPVSYYISPKALEANKSVFYNKDGSVKTTKQIVDWASSKMGEVSENYQSKNEFAYTPSTQSTTIVQNLPKSEESVNFTLETQKLEQQAKEKEAAFLQEYQNSFAQEQPQETVEEQPTQLPQTNLVDIFNQVSQFVDEPLMQSGGKYRVKDEREQAKIIKDNTNLPQPTTPKKPTTDARTANTFGNLLGNLSDYFLGTDVNSNRVESSYRPTVEKDKNSKYYTYNNIKNDVVNNLTGSVQIQNKNKEIERYKKLYGDNYESKVGLKKDFKYTPDFETVYDYYKNANGNMKSANTGSGINLGEYRITSGEDKKGRYISIHDTYDWDIMGSLAPEGWEIYDRIYEDEFKNIKKKLPIKQQGGKYKVKDEREEGQIKRDNILPQIKDKKLILQQIELENKDKEELQKTGTVKAPRSLAYKKQAAELQSRMTNVSQDKLTPQKRAEYNDAMDKVQNESLKIGDRPLIYLADPSKILGDLGVSGFNTSEEDRQKINLNRYNPVLSTSEKFKNNLEMGLGYVPEASLNLAMGAAFAPESAGIRGVLNETLNPLAGTVPKKDIINDLNSLLETFNPKNLKARDGEQWIKDWYDAPETFQKADKYNEEGMNLKGDTKILLAQQDLKDYTDKTYRDLIKDRGVIEGLKKFMSSNGLSYGIPEAIYTKSQPHFGLNKVARESVKVHELTHLAEKNGHRFNTKENDALLEPFGYNTKEIYETDKTPLEVLGSRDKAYYLDPTEIHARMNEARYQLGLKPEDQFTKEDFDKVQKAHNWFGMGKYIKDKDAFVKLMNNFYVAAPVVGAVTVANKENKQQGGIPVSSKGMYEFPNQKVIVPSTRITMKDIPNYILAITDEGDKQILEPEKEYKLKGNSTLEIPLTEAEKNFLKELKF